ncbi:zinc finger and BTB domain-containing protein 8A isoform X2 [Scleropages formosus]|uniref:Zinc finger and BTB domain containing 8A n=1 Tax=Scleropages formosus TaxID=113540 RepID=A0A8C9SPL6_SCLFO|nr:zinc finger and BTB domain-containing protein 8A isoform X2 [Scleropages formosus]
MTPVLVLVLSVALGRAGRAKRGRGCFKRRSRPSGAALRCASLRSAPLHTHVSSGSFVHGAPFALGLNGGGGEADMNVGPRRGRGTRAHREHTATPDMEPVSDRRSRGSAHPSPQQVSRASSTDMMAAHQSHLLKQLDEQRRQELFCDCHVLVEGQLFKAHRNVLFGSSGYFRMLLSRGADECGTPVTASFEAFSPDTFAVILDFVYSGRLDLTSLNVIEVMSAASYLQMNDVISFCKDFIKSSLDISVREEDDRYLSLSEGASSLKEERLAPWPTASPRAEYGEEIQPDVVSLKREPGAASRCGRRRGRAVPPQTCKAEARRSVAPSPERSTRASGKRKAWSSTPGVEMASLLDPQGAPANKARKADELYATLPTIVGVVGIFNKDSSPSMRFKCPFCTHTVKRKADLKRHLRCHTGERPYPCEACSKRFTRLEHLRSHFETIHQARKLVCRKCKRHVTELSGRVVCEGTRRYRLCNECIQESGCDGLVADGCEPGDGAAALLSAAAGDEDDEDKEDKEEDWLAVADDDDDEDELAVDSGADLIIQEVDASDEEQELHG